MLHGRLGLDSARIPHGDRHGVLWVGHGRLYVEDGSLRSSTSGAGDLPAGDYAIPHQMVSASLMGPGSTVSHDALRILARHGTGLVAVADNGDRHYASMPFGPARSARARSKARAWSDEHGGRHAIARRMYAWRLGTILPSADIEVLRGIEGARMREAYRHLAEQYGIRWTRREYDRELPTDSDAANHAVNHASAAMYALAGVAVATTGTIPQLGFIHEESGVAFALDIADLFRDSIMLPAAFEAVAMHARASGETPSNLEQNVRRGVGSAIRKSCVLERMIDRIKELFDDDDSRRDTKPVG